MPFKWAAMGWAERVRADPPSRLFAGVGWEAAGVAPTCSVPLGKLLCRSRRPSLEVVVFFLPSLGCVGKLSPRGWNWSSLLQWLCLGCHGLDLGTWMGCAALGVKDWVSWPGT